MSRAPTAAVPEVPLLPDLLLAALLGALHSLPFVFTWGWPLQMMVVAVLAWRVACATQLRSALLGLVFGTAWLLSGTWWLFISLYRYGGLPGWLAGLAVTLLCLFLSLYLSFAMALFARGRSGAAWRDALLFGALWLLAELARGVIFTGFPWIASGYAHVDSPLASLAPWVGVYGIGFFSATLAAWPAVGATRTAVARLVALGILMAVLGAAKMLGPAQFTHESSTLSVTLLQGNVAQDEKFALELMPQALAWTKEHLLAARGDLVVAPETVIPVLPDQLEPGYWDELAQNFQKGSQAALIGLPLGNDEVGYTNSAAGLSKSTVSLPGGFYRYDKHHLVPFGEFIPYGFRWFTILMNIPLGDFNRGPVGPPSFEFRTERIGANICYEDLFGEELAARFGQDRTAPTIFANISNIGWFGDTIAIDQHLQISRMRTLEFQRPMLRATNTGATAIIDYRGRVTGSLPPYSQGTLGGAVQGRTGLTPFARWACAFGLWPPTCMAVLLVLVLSRRSVRRSVWRER